ncbi:GntR family transcriptional regulator [Streptomyces parvulus]|uniref:GntR family transcriptional regulator n=1 Tax=Streptomyces parvulus TaxID=146923 RepID=UPI003436FD07
MPPGLERSSSVASQRIADSLRRRILAGELEPGTRIRQEDVAESLRSSRLPVREALRILSAEGLVTLRPNSGAWVSVMDLAECQATYKLRERVEPLVLSESIPHLTSDDLGQIEELQREIENGPDVDRLLALDRDLHLITYSRCPIDQLLTMVQRFWNTTQHYRRAYARLVDPSGREVIIFEHRLIIEALKRRDAVDAERFLVGHIRRTRLALAQHPELFVRR